MLKECLLGMCLKMNFSIKIFLGNLDKIQDRDGFKSKNLYG